MALRAVCVARGCGKTVGRKGGRCPRHARQESKRKSSKIRQHGYSSANWQLVRSRRLLMDNSMCQIKLPGCTGRATMVHLDPALLGDHRFATILDCVSCCPSCSGAVDAPRAVA